MRKRLIADAIIWGLVIVAALGATGCTRVRLDSADSKSGISTEQLSVPLEGAQKLDARIKVPAGEFSLEGGSALALEGDVRHSSDWSPRVDYSVDATTGVLRVDQNMEDVTIKPFKQAANEWDIRLAEGIPVDLDVELGAGESTIDLREVDVRKLDALTGVGETTIDLSGARVEDITARVESGVGELTIRVPRDVGVRVVAESKGVGEFEAPGFSADGYEYVNDAYGKTAATIDVRLHQGIGRVAIESVP